MASPAASTPNAAISPPEPRLDPNVPSYSGAACSYSLSSDGLIIKDGPYNETELPANLIIAVLPAASGPAPVPASAPGHFQSRDNNNCSHYLLQGNAHGEIKHQLLTTPVRLLPAPFMAHYLIPDVDGRMPAHLHPDTAEITVLLSTASGGGDETVRTYWAHGLQSLLIRLGLPFKQEETTTPDSVAALARRLAARAAEPGAKTQTLLLLSGDTAIHEAINAAAASVIPYNDGKQGRPRLVLGVFPLGTGNALASSLHEARGIYSISAMLLGRPHPLPQFRARFSPGARWLSPTTPDEVVPEEGVRGAVVLSWGFHAALVADAEGLRGAGVGVERFQRAAMANLVGPDAPHRFRGRVSVRTTGGPAEWMPVGDDGEGHFYVLAATVSNLEEKFCISPAWKPGERLFRLISFPPLSSADDVGAVMKAAYDKGKHVLDERVDYRPAKAVRIQIDEEEERWRRVCVDGRIVVLEKGGWVEGEMLGPGEDSVDVIWREEGWEAVFPGEEEGAQKGEEAT